MQSGRDTNLFVWKISRAVFLVLTFTFFLIAAALNTILASSANLQHAPGIPLLFHSTITLLTIVYIVIVIPARLRDSSLSPWMTLLILIPLVNVALWLFLFSVTKESIARRKSANPPKSEKDSWNI